jgi:large subunit ribosomal protein L32
MPNPKRRHSKQRRDKRRAHDALSIPNLGRCPHCQELKLPHRICPACGHYKGREIVETQQNA